MERELQRLREADRKNGLDFAPMAENLEKNFVDNIKTTIQLEQEINGGSKIYPNCNKLATDFYGINGAVPFGRIKGSGGFYLLFGNNTTQEKINTQSITQVSKKI